MMLEDVKKILKVTGDLRLLTKENGGVRITDLFLNDDCEVRLEQYSVITKEDIQNETNISDKDISISEVIDNLLSSVKLWLLFEDDNAKEGFDKFENLFIPFIVDDISKIPYKEFNETIIDFLNGDLDQLLFKIKK